MAIATGDVVQISYRARLYDQRILCVQNYVCIDGTGSGPTIDEVTALLTYLNDPATGGKPLAEMVEMQSEQLEYESVRAQKIWPAREVYIEQAQLVTGVINATAGTANTAATLIKRSNYPGRKGHSNLHLAGVPQSDIDGGLLSAPAKAALLEVGNALKTTITPAGSPLEWIACVSADATAIQTTVKWVVADDRAKTMRRRTLRVGE